MCALPKRGFTALQYNNIFMVPPPNVFHMEASPPVVELFKKGLVAWNLEMVRLAWRMWKVLEVEVGAVAHSRLQGEAGFRCEP